MILYAVIIAVLILLYTLGSRTSTRTRIRTRTGIHTRTHTGGQPCACEPKGDNVKRCPQIPCKRPGLLLSAYRNIGEKGIQGDKIYPLEGDTPLPKNITLMKGQVLGSVKVNQDYILSFDIIIKEVSPGWSNILHFSSSQKDCCNFGDRMPGIWITPGTTSIDVAIGDRNPGQGNWRVSTDPLPMSQKLRFELRCKGKEITIGVNGKTYNFIQPSERPTGRAVVYGSDPWYDAAKADITDLHYMSMPDQPIDHSNFNEDIDFDWTGKPILGTNFNEDVYLQFQGYIKSPYTGELYFRVQSDDGSELKVADKTVVSMWQTQSATFGASGPINVRKDRYYPIDLKYYQHLGPSTLRLYWRYDSYDWQIVPHAYFFRDDPIVDVPRVAFPTVTQPPLQWKTIPGTLRHVSTGNNWTWGVSNTSTNGGFNVYVCRAPCDGGWSLVPGGLVQIDVGTNDVWGVNSGGAIYRRPADGTGDWEHIQGWLKHISAGPTDWVWGVNENNDIYRCVVQGSCRGQWEKVPGKLKQLDVGSDSVWGVNGNNDIYTRPVNGTGDWTNIPGKLKYVTVSDQYIYGTDPSDKVFRCKTPCKGQWEQVPGTLRQLDANNSNGLIGTNSKNEILRS